MSNTKSHVWKKKLLQNKATIFFTVCEQQIYHGVMSDFLGCKMCVRNKINSLVSKVKGAKGPGALYFLMEKKELV